MRLDDWMPTATALVSERHSLHIAASPARIYAALWEADFGGPVANTLLGLRALPRVVARWISQGDRGARRTAPSPGLTLRRFLEAGFALLEEVPGDELVLGLTGRFWTPTGGLVPTVPETFRNGPALGQAQAAWNFRLVADGAEGTELITETRVRVAEDARRSFLLYWSVVRPFSGLLRRKMLRDVRRASAEGAR